MRRAPLLALLLALAAAPAGAAKEPAVPLSHQLDGGPHASASQPRFETHVRVSPPDAPVGARFVYHGWVRVPQGTKVRFVPPKSGGELTWGEVHAGRQISDRPVGWDVGYNATFDSVWVQTTVQSFADGPLALPGLEVEMNDVPGTLRGRLPVAHVVVTSVLSAADSNADLRAVHGPYAAPWWERVPWTTVALLALLAVALVALVVWLVRRRRRIAAIPAAVPVPVVPRRSPADEALGALAELRSRQLPEQGRFAEHAFELTRITRVFLERTLATPRPGDTSAELVDRLRSGALGSERLERLAALLSLWDRVKFARAPLTVAEARRAEDAVEAFVARPAGDVPREVA